MSVLLTLFDSRVEQHMNSDVHLSIAKSGSDGQAINTIGLQICSLEDIQLSVIACPEVSKQTPYLSQFCSQFLP